MKLDRPFTGILLDRPFTGILNDLQRRLRSRDGYSDIINLGLGNPGTPVDPALLDLVHQDIDQSGGMAAYGSSGGDLLTKKTIANFMTQVRKTPYQFDANCNQVAIIGGITETIKEYFLALYNKSAEIDGETVKHKKLRVLIPTPAYAWYFDALKKVAGVEAIKMDTHDTGWKLDAKSLEHFLNQSPPPDALILNYPCNPTGQDLTEAQWGDVAAVLKAHVKAHPEFRIVLDNAYKDLSFEPHKGLFEVAPELMQHGIEFNSVAKFHGYAGRKGPGFAVSQNAEDIAMLRRQLNPDLGIGMGYEAFLRGAFDPSYFTPECVEKALGMYRRRCRFVTNYINEQLAPTQGTNSHIALPTEGGMFVFADFSRWLGKQIVHKEARKLRQLLSEIMPENSGYFNHEAFKNDTINDDKDLSLYLILKAQVVTIPGQDFGAAPGAGMLRLALGDIGDLTTYKQTEQSEDFRHYLPEEPDLERKPLDDLRKLKAVMDRAISTLRILEQERGRS